MQTDASQITRLLHRWGEGDTGAFDELIPIVYERLHQMAHQRLRGEASERSLNTTGLVHEAYVRLVEVSEPSFRDRSHFLAVASRVMRNLLVDRARARNAARRGGGLDALPLHEHLWISEAQAEAVTELNDALKRLESLDVRQSRILEQRYFGGLSLAETAGALGVSVATVKRELRSARAWLAAELGAVPGPLP
jgi:RNA polymerase sigma factor (TIGR02999 family)